VHGDGKTLFRELLDDLLLFGYVVPNPDCFIFRTSYNQLFPDTNIKAGDGIGVETTVDEFDLDGGLSLIIERKLSAQDLVVLGDVVDVVLGVRQAQRSDQVGLTSMTNYHLVVSGSCLVHFHGLLCHWSIGLNGILDFLVRLDSTSTSDDEASLAERNDGIDASLVTSGQAYEAIVLTTVVANDDLTKGCADNEVGVFEPLMAAVLSCYLSILVVDLSQNGFKLIVFNFDQFENCITSHKANVILVGVVGAHQVVVQLLFTSVDARKTNLNLREHLDVLKVPQK
jgi:hypothetical protein